MTRTVALLLALAAALLAAPLFSGSYLVSVLIAFLFQAALGIAWNVMMGFAGQFSLGHALYIGLGAYGAAALFTLGGVAPLIGVPLAALASAAVAATIGALGFRLGVRGVHFALLTIAFAEVARIAFDHWDLVGGSAGLFLPVVNRVGNDMWALRGDAVMFYYLLLALVALMLGLCAWILRTRLGYFWLAVREDQEAAETLGVPVFRTKMAAVMISAAMTSVAGSLYAFYTNALYPESLFSMHRSIELMLGPIIGGLGTLAGPVLGAALLTVLGEGLSSLSEGLHLDGLKQFAYGVILVLVVIRRPEGLWPWLRDRFARGGRQ